MYLNPNLDRGCSFAASEEVFVLAEVDYLTAMACLAADVRSVTCWCTFLLWCKALWCSRGWPTKNCIQEQITVELLFTHIAVCSSLGQPWWQEQVPFPQKKTDQATGTCWPHTHCPEQIQGNMIITWITTRHTDITDNQLGFKVFCQPGIFYVYLNPH